MCGRYVRAQEKVELASLFHAGADATVPGPSWNIKPTQTIVVVREGSAGRQLEPARWSLIPTWAKTPKLKFSTFNARSEDAASKSTWRAGVKSKRCLIPAEGYYEWITRESGKVPQYIHSEAGEGLAFAGLYSWWRGSEAEPWLLTATILTMASVPELEAVHDRNPVALPEAWWDDWLARDLEGDQAFVDAAVAAVAAARPVLADCAWHAVVPLREDGPELIVPAEV